MGFDTTSDRGNLVDDVNWSSTGWGAADFENGCAIMSWFYLTSLDDNEYGFFGNIIGYIHLHVYDIDRAVGPKDLRLRGVVDGNNVLVGATGLSANTWYCGVATNKSSASGANSHQRLYLNGSQDQSNTVVGAPDFIVTSFPITIGDWKTGTGFRPPGYHAATAIWGWNGTDTSARNYSASNETLTAAEVAFLYNSKCVDAALLVQPKFLLALWIVDEFGNGVEISGTNVIRNRAGGAEHVNHLGDAGTPLGYTKTGLNYLSAGPIHVSTTVAAAAARRVMVIS